MKTAKIKGDNKYRKVMAEIIQKTGIGNNGRCKIVVEHGSATVHPKD